MALRSKGYWGYDQEFLDACRAELTFRPEDVVTRRIAREAGYTSLLIEADPNAVGFYEAMGADRIGEVPSGSLPGRTLPLLVFRLTRADAPR